MENLDAESIATLVKGGVATLSVALSSKPAALLIEKISGALGWYAEPRRIIRNAKAEAAASIIKAEAEQEAKSVSERTAQRILNEEEKYQKNMENIALGAIASVTADAKPDEIDDDWLDGFFSRARHISNEEVQKLWSHVLSGEANKPGSFSLRTLNLLATLTKKDASLFRKLCAYNFLDYDSDFGIAHVSIVTRDMIMQSDKYGIGYAHAFDLQDIGFVVYEQDPKAQFSVSSKEGEPIVYYYHGLKLEISKPNSNDETLKRIEKFPIGKMSLTQVGRELASICAPNPDWDYFSYIVKMWTELGFYVVCSEVQPV